MLRIYRSKLKWNRFLGMVLQRDAFRRLVISFQEDDNIVAENCLESYDFNRKKRSNSRSGSQTGSVNSGLATSNVGSDIVRPPTLLSWFLLMPDSQASLFCWATSIRLTDLILLVCNVQMCYSRYKRSFGVGVRILYTSPQLVFPSKDQKFFLTSFFCGAL